MSHVHITAVVGDEQLSITYSQCVSVA